MAEWQSGRVAEWQSGRVAEWRSGGVAEWRSGGVAEWRSDRCFCFQIHVLSQGVYYVCLVHRQMRMMLMVT